MPASEWFVQLYAPIEINRGKPEKSSEFIIRSGIGCNGG